MKMRKLKWKKDNAIKDKVLNCCSWFTYDKKSNIHFDVCYYQDDIAKDKFSVDIIAWIGDSDQNLIEEEGKTTKWDLKRFEKYELSAFKIDLISKVQLKLIDILDAVKRIQS